MKVLKKYLTRYFIDAMGSMALGLFASLLIGTIFGTVYKYTELAPVEALAFGAKCVKTLGPLMSGIGGALSAVSRASAKASSILCWVTA